jgi:hypothetical protein
MYLPPQPPFVSTGGPRPARAVAVRAVAIRAVAVRAVAVRVVGQLI